MEHKEPSDAAAAEIDTDDLLGLLRGMGKGGDGDSGGASRVQEL